MSSEDNNIKDSIESIGSILNKRYSSDIYIHNCKKMIKLNTEEHLKASKRLEREKRKGLISPRDLSNLEDEVDGWKNWVDTWEYRLEEALKAKEVKSKFAEEDK